MIQLIKFLKWIVTALTKSCNVKFSGGLHTLLKYEPCKIYTGQELDEDA